MVGFLVKEWDEKLVLMRRALAKLLRLEEVRLKKSEECTVLMSL